MQIRPLGPTLAAEVTGVDLSGGLTAGEVDLIRQAWLEHLVLVFRDQDLDAAAQAEFARRFGELERVRTTPDSPDREQVAMYVSNREVEGSKGVLPDGEMLFHSDQCYYDVPCKATLLHALQLPSHGGNTLFASGYRAYEALPEHVRARVRGLEAVNVYDYKSNPTHRSERPGDDAPRAVHPVVVEHPETHRPVLYVNRLMTHGIVGLDAAESSLLLEELLAAVEDARFVYEHVWRPGDMLMWDNRCALHARTDFDPGQARVLRRYTVRGDGRPRAFDRLEQVRG